MYHDLNIPIERGTRADEIRPVLLAAKKLGYTCVALNITIAGKFTQEDVLPFVDLGDESSTPLLPLRIHGPATQPFRQLRRLTAIVEDKAHMHQLNSTNPLLPSFDLLAVRTSNEGLFHRCLEELEVDIVSMDLSQRISFPFRNKTVGIAVQRGIMFEISYSASLKDQTARRNLLSAASSLIRATRGKNILLTSEARRALELRGPHDVINLTSLFGLDIECARKSLTDNARAAVLHAEARNSVRGVFKVETPDATSESQAWQVPHEPSASASSSSSPMATSATTSKEAKGKEAKGKEAKGGNVKRKRDDAV